MKKNAYIIGLNPSVADKLIQRSIVKEVVLVDQLDSARLQPGDVVIGDLPVPVAANLARQGVHYGFLAATDKPDTEIQWFNVSTVSLPLNTSSQSLYDGIFTDWDEDREDQQSYSISVVDEKLGINVLVKKGTDSETQPAINVYFEVNKGVPAIHVSATEFGDNNLHIHSADDGLYVTPEQLEEIIEAPVNEFSYDQPGSFYIPVDRTLEAETTPSL